MNNTNGKAVKPTNGVQRADRGAAATFECGFHVEIWTVDQHPSAQGFIGEVQAVDEHGIRLTLLDWLSCRFSGFDQFIPWSRIVEAQISTPEHSTNVFLNQIAVRELRQSEARQP